MYGMGNVFGNAQAVVLLQLGCRCHPTATMKAIYNILRLLCLIGVTTAKATLLSGVPY